MSEERESDTAARILAQVVRSLERGGYDSVYVQEVARGARVSLTTVYKLFGTRDELIVAAIERWMAQCSYTAPPAPPGETLREGLMRLLRGVFEPWERSPQMLKAYHRALCGPGGHRLDIQGRAAVRETATAVLAAADPGYRDDLDRILVNLSYGLISRYAAGALDIAEIMPTLERAVHRLTADNELAADVARPRGVATEDTASGTQCRARNLL
ncbi:TetR family transcriptional regulator [Nocardia wallacei]|uniref:TetR family transcriptional regulator n=1 Tax=Nocardia wallacei TaxID=480035 RepID=UPI002456B503|nr:TetR family transcriptional regulator [Nocardia wallacei]